MASSSANASKPRIYPRLPILISAFTVLALFSTIHIHRLAPLFHFPSLSFTNTVSETVDEHAVNSEYRPSRNSIYTRFTREQIDAWTHIDVRANFRRLLPEDLPSSPNASRHDVCLFIGRDPNAWHLWDRRNSRSICVTSPVCIATDAHNTVMHTSDFSQTECRVVTPAYNPLPVPFDDPHRHEPRLWPCAEAQHRLQLCPWSSESQPFPEPCITPHSAHPATFDHTLQTAENNSALYKGVTLVVPRYAFGGNIYHFAAMIAAVAHAVVNLPTILAHYGLHKLNPPNALDDYPLNILFLSQRRSGFPWQSGLETVLTSGRMSRVFPRGLQVSFISDQSSSHVCIENPVLMGQRGHVNAWPFPNSSEIVLDGSQVPKDSIEFRQDVYSALDIQPPPIFRDDHGLLRIRVPPLALGYAKRGGRSSVVGAGVHAAGTVRRFSDDDEAWFLDMLTNETRSREIELHEFLTTSDETFADQVKKTEKVGFIVGIHGANLANCIFMRPMGVLLEIFPANVSSSCYIGGSNSGLAYLVHEAQVKASPQESGCSIDENRCWKLSRQRLVKIGTKGDRDALRDLVRRGISYLTWINVNFPDGVPVRYDPLTSYYVFNGSTWF